MAETKQTSPLTVCQQLIEVCRTTPGRLLTAFEIKRRVIDSFGTNANSIIPSDHCYNRWNRGIRIRTPIFVRVGKSEYRYIGPNQPYTGLVFGRPKGTTADKIVGEWVDGALTLYEGATNPSDDTTASVVKQAAAMKAASLAKPTENSEQIPLSSKQLDRLYEEYMEILSLEISEFGCKPTETRHLIGRLGEFYCARLTQGRLATRVNQHGFDVVSGVGKRVSVKTTAQQGGFVSLNPNTASKADELMVLRYTDRDFEVIYHGPVAPALQLSRLWNGRYELDIAKARLISSNASKLS